MRYMKEIVKKNQNLVLFYLAIGLFNAFMSNYKAHYFQRIVDGLTDRTISVSAILLYGAVLLIHYGMNYLDEYPSSKLGNTIYLDFKLMALRKIGKMDYLEYQKLGTGKLVQQIENGANAGKGVLHDFWFCVIRNLLPTILFSLFFIWEIDKTITYFLMGGYIVVFFATNILLNGLYQVKERILTNEEEFNHYLVRGFMEMLIFRMKGQFPNEVNRAAKAKEQIVSAKVKMTMIHEAFFAIFASFVACLDAGILIYAWKNGNLSIGSIVALITLIDHAYTPIAIFNVLYVQYRLNKTAWRRFAGLLAIKEDMQLQEGLAFDGLCNEICIEHVSFLYESKKVLDDINLSIKKGEKVAFVGESGSGKSTLAKLLLGLLKFHSGSIRFDDCPLQKISLESLYKKVSYLSQDAPVFDGTIQENLVFDKDVSEAALRGGLEAVQLSSKLSSLDAGVNTRIGEKGTRLSGGEKQRLALARLWFEDSDIVILDEATSALDHVTEAIVMEHVLTQVSQATVIAIAHRLATISGFDKIVVFKNGKVIGCGTFGELLKTNPYFHDLYRREQERSGF